MIHILVYAWLLWGFGVLSAFFPYFWLQFAVYHSIPSILNGRASNILIWTRARFSGFVSSVNDRQEYNKSMASSCWYLCLQLGHILHGSTNSCTSYSPASLDFALAYSLRQDAWAKPDWPRQEQSRSGGFLYLSGSSYSNHIQQGGICSWSSTCSCCCSCRSSCCRCYRWLVATFLSTNG